MERLLFLVAELWQFIVPVFEVYLVGVEVEILDKIVVGVHDLLEQTSAVERHFFVVFVSRSDAARPNERKYKNIADVFFFIVTILTHPETILNAA